MFYREIEVFLSLMSYENTISLAVKVKQIGEIIFAGEYREFFSTSEFIKVLMAEFEFLIGQ
jgi:hypothetical protein